MMSNKEESKPSGTKRAIGELEGPTKDTLSEGEIESDDDQSPVKRRGMIADMVQMVLGKRFLIKKLNRHAIKPRKISSRVAGFDLFAFEAVTLEPNSTTIIDTKIAMQIPVSYYGHIVENPELAAKHSLVTLGGVVDANYRSEIKVVLRNLSAHSVNFHPGNRIAKIIIKKIHDAHEVVIVQKLD